ncbi:MAG: NlpC/P60 family protein [Tenacibaculum sp.]
MFGICNLSIIAMRSQPSDASEMLNQVLFGEHFSIIEKGNKWSKIKLYYDQYTGYINNLQYIEIIESDYNALCQSKKYYAGQFVNFITDNTSSITSIPLGASLPFLKNNSLRISNRSFSYRGKVYNQTKTKSSVVKLAYLFLNVPYLWGGKSVFGIDCSGFTQTVYKLSGCNLLRDAKQQATQGKTLGFIEESEPGDLAFFDNQDGLISHVGIVLKSNYIIHAHGKVRVDKLNHSGIYNLETGKCSHKLKLIKRLL